MHEVDQIISIECRQVCQNQIFIYFNSFILVCGLSLGRRLPRMQEAVVRVPPRAKFVFNILLYLEWNVKNCL